MRRYKRLIVGTVYFLKNRDQCGYKKIKLMRKRDISIILILMMKFEIIENLVRIPVNKYNTAEIYENRLTVCKNDCINGISYISE